MTVTEAFDEVRNACDDEAALAGIMNGIGHPLPLVDGVPETAFIPPEIKVAVGMLLIDSKSPDVTYEAKKALSDGLARMCQGKPAEGEAEASMEKALTDNIDLI